MSGDHPMCLACCESLHHGQWCQALSRVPGSLLSLSIVVIDVKQLLCVFGFPCRRVTEQRALQSLLFLTVHQRNSPPAPQRCTATCHLISHQLYTVLYFVSKKHTFSWQIVCKVLLLIMVWRCSNMTSEAAEILMFAGGVVVVISWFDLGGRKMKLHYFMRWLFSSMLW